MGASQLAAARGSRIAGHGRGDSGARTEAVLVVAEHLVDVDNVGSCFRNARAFGARGVLLDERCPDPLYRKAVRTSLGDRPRRAVGAGADPATCSKPSPPPACPRGARRRTATSRDRRDRGRTGRRPCPVALVVGNEGAWAVGRDASAMHAPGAHSDGGGGGLAQCRDGAGRGPVRVAGPPSLTRPGRCVTGARDKPGGDRTTATRRAGAGRRVHGHEHAGCPRGRQRHVCGCHVPVVDCRRHGRRTVGPVAGLAPDAPITERRAAGRWRSAASRSSRRRWPPRSSSAAGSRRPWPTSRGRRRRRRRATGRSWCRSEAAQRSAALLAPSTRWRPTSIATIRGRGTAAARVPRHDDDGARPREQLPVEHAADSLEAEDRLPQETLDLFDQLIQDNAAELRLLGELRVVREKEMAVGTGIEYRTTSGNRSQVSS